MVVVESYALACAAEGGAGDAEGEGAGEQGEALDVQASRDHDVEAGCWKDGRGTDGPCGEGGGPREPTPRVAQPHPQGADIVSAWAAWEGESCSLSLNATASALSF